MLLKDLCEKHKIGKKNLVRHKDISPGRKFDIDDSFRSPHYSSWENFKSSLFTLTKKEMEKKQNEVRLLTEGMVGSSKAVYRLADELDNSAAMDMAAKMASYARDLLEEMGFDTSDTY
jgi:N-acetyl-anhydromuramyl-L-alanine amidase AmpD